MRRREFLVAAGALLADQGARAQSAGRHYRDGVLCPFLVDQAARFESLVNLRAAQAIGLRIPNPILLLPTS